jgi:uncharacterized protein YbaP (TraB family)
MDRTARARRARPTRLGARLRTRIAGALAGLGALFAAACAPLAQAPAPTVAAAPRIGPALWRVADADTTIYLFGTVHALPSGVDWMRGEIPAALASADTLVTEVDMSEAASASPQLQSDVVGRAMLPKDESLRDLLDPRQRGEYEAAIAKLGMPVEAFDRYKPWYAALMFTMVPLMKQGYAGKSGVETGLAGQAAGKRHDALETIDFQLSVFDDLPRAEQVAYLMQVIEGSEDVKATLDAMVADWLAGDADGLAVLMNEDMGDDPVLADRLLYARNRKWADWIVNRLDTPGTVFMAVGAGHLAGKGSVQDVLAQRGIAAARIQ